MSSDITPIQPGDSSTSTPPSSGEGTSVAPHGINLSSIGALQRTAPEVYQAVLKSFELIAYRDNQNAEERRKARARENQI